MGNINCHHVASVIVDISNKVYNKVNETLDFVSYHVCPDRPTNRLATDNLQIPPQDLGFLEKIGEFIHEVLGLCIMPFEMLINKKFSIHIYESSNVFPMPGGNNQPVQNSITTCDKVLIYIGQNNDKVLDSRDKQIIKTVQIDNKDYELPVNWWYHFKIDDDKKVYFYIHCSTLSNYKGVVVAVNKINETNLATMKDKIIEFYNQTLGVRVVNNNNNIINNDNNNIRENFI